ncbi:hypothetical protein [Saccharomonospora saliphila]|uniref:hypothetical protein n=1 Tax=Saccharomonospora saliphila TaxID=369829 RepID=UPI001E514262|nr:hypothetical protein [Saccharomonospora saliphila]
MTAKTRAQKPFPPAGPAAGVRCAEHVLTVDCSRCRVRGTACADCALTHVAESDTVAEWDAAQRGAVAALADGGLVPRLRYVPALTRPDRTGGRSARSG